MVFIVVTALLDTIQNLIIFGYKTQYEKKKSKNGLG